jgi:heme/copper-type cytochrome/quinol oxidase subunit 2
MLSSTFKEELVVVVVMVVVAVVMMVVMVVVMVMVIFMVMAVEERCGDGNGSQDERCVFVDGDEKKDGERMLKGR